MSVKVSQQKPPFHGWRFTILRDFQISKCTKFDPLAGATELTSHSPRTPPALGPLSLALSIPAFSSMAPRLLGAYNELNVTTATQWVVLAAIAVVTFSFGRGRRLRTGM